MKDEQQRKKRHNRRTWNNQTAEGKVTIKADEMIGIDNDENPK